MFIILTTWELSVSRIDLQAPTLAESPWTNLGAGNSSCTTPGPDLKFNHRKLMDFLRTQISRNSFIIILQAQ